MIAAVSLRLLYLIFQKMLRLVLLLGRTSSSKDVELLVLRHEVLAAADGDDDGAIHGDDVNRAFGRRSSAGWRCSRHGAGWWSATCRVVVVIVAPACGRARTRPDPIFSRRARAAVASG